MALPSPRVGLAALAEALENGRVRARDLVEDALARIDDETGEGARAFVAVNGDTARAQADLVDSLRQRGRAPSPYAGIAFAVKDLFDVAGETTAAGSKILRSAPPATRDATAIARLKAAGLIVIGRNNMTEFAYSGVGLNPHFGTPPSVWDRETGRIPGGSSSGGGVAVGEGQVALAIGTDTGGSCRIPAAFNSIVGYKSSVGRVPTAGTYPLSTTFDSIGPLAGSVADCALADAMMAGDWSGEIVAREPSSIRLGLVRQLFFDDLDREVAAAFDSARTRLERAGVQFIDIDFAEVADLPAINAGGGIVAAEAFAHHEAMIAEHGDDYDQRVRARIESGARITAPELVRLMRTRQRLVERANELSRGIDGWFMPTTACLPPPISAFTRDEDYGRLNFFCLRNTFAGNFLDRCAISLPLTGRGEAPVGGMIMAPLNDDQALFATAAAVEKVLEATG